MEYKQYYSTNSTNTTSINSVSPTQSTTELCYDDMVDDAKHNGQIQRVIKTLNYATGSKIAETLQGSIWRVSKADKFNSVTAILKVANQFLQKHSQAHVNGARYNVLENIVTEQSILKYLTEQPDCPDSITKYLGFFKSKTDYFLLQEDGGECLYDFITKAHQFIQNGNLDINHWKLVCKEIFKQMVKSVQYIHSKQITHMDISLENWLINDVGIEIIPHPQNKKKWKMRFLISDIKIKLCDFGVAEYFSGDDFRSNKFCGKPAYRSPGFNAKSNDIFSLGVCLFAMCTGTSPWARADESDPLWQYVVKYGVKNLLSYWNSLQIVDGQLLVF